MRTVQSAGSGPGLRTGISVPGLPLPSYVGNEFVKPAAHTARSIAHTAHTAVGRRWGHIAFTSARHFFNTKLRTKFAPQNKKQLSWLIISARLGVVALWFTWQISAIYRVSKYYRGKRRQFDNWIKPETHSVVIIWQLCWFQWSTNSLSS